MTLVEAFAAYRPPKPGESGQEAERGGAVLLTALQRLARSMRVSGTLAEDAVAELMVRFYVGVNATFESDAAVRGFLRVCLRREIIDRIRAAHGEQQMNDAASPGIASPGTGAPPSQDERRSLTALCSRLTPVLRSAARELLEIRFGSVTAESVVARSGRKTGERLTTVQARKHQQYHRVVQQLHRLVDDSPLGMWDRALLHYRVDELRLRPVPARGRVSGAGRRGRSVNRAAR